VKHRAAHKAIGVASAGVALVLASAVTWLLNTPPTADCIAEAPAEHRVHKILAAKVVVQPWRIEATNGSPKGISSTG